MSGAAGPIEPIVVAHRTPASTAECADLAAAGATLFEVDVQLRGGALVVSHYLPLAAGLERDNWRVRRTRAGRELTLAEVVAHVPASSGILIDPKAGNPGELAELAGALVDELAGDRSAQRHWVVSTSEPQALDTVRAAGLRTWRTIGSRAALRQVLAGPPLADEAVTVRHSLLSADVVHALHARAPAVVAWTVNQARRAELVRSWGVDGITTDSRHAMSSFR